MVSQIGDKRGDNAILSFYIIPETNQDHHMKNNDDADKNKEYDLIKIIKKVVKKLKPENYQKGKKVWT